MDNRAQAHGLVAFVAMLVTGALLFIIFQPAADAIFDAFLATTSDQSATDAINQRQEIFGLILYFVIFVGGIFLIARAVLQSRSPG